jgi:hypothetical protein
MGSASIVYIPRPPTYCAQEKAMTIILSRVDEIANEAARKMEKAKPVVAKKMEKGSALIRPGAAPTRPFPALTSLYLHKWPSQSSCSTISPAKKEDLEAMAGIWPSSQSV